MFERKLASIRRVEALHPIFNADKIEAAQIGGWWTVVKKGEFRIGDLAIYCEIDSWIPHTVAPFLTKNGKHPKLYGEILGERLKTVRLRGQLSQGLLLPLHELEARGYDGELVDGTDVTEFLGIIKWERPIPGGPQMRGIARSTFPSFIKKTDQERIQNCKDKLAPWNLDKRYEVSIKLDGSSITVYAVDGTPGVCSRNIDLKLTVANSENRFVATARSSGLLEDVLSYNALTGRNIAVQGELMGPGIQGNREKFTEYKIFIFNIYDIDRHRDLDPFERSEMCYMLKHINNTGSTFEHVPCYWRVNSSDLDSEAFSLERLGVNDIESILALPESIEITDYFKKHEFTLPIEGLVFKPFDNSGSFKVINNKFLLSEKD